jgi:hypothetical protein
VIAKEVDESGQRIADTPGAVDPAAEAEHMEVCPRCGQSFDNRILHQVIYHDQPIHKPIHKPIELNS